MRKNRRWRISAMLFGLFLGFVVDGGGLAQQGESGLSGSILVAQNTLRSRLNPVARMVLSPSGKYVRRRFDDGPRWVPQARGLAQKRAAPYSSAADPTTILQTAPLPVPSRSAPKCMTILS